MKRSGRLVAAARRVIEIDDVLEASITCGGRASLSATKILRFTSSFSVAASITRSQEARSSKLAAGSMRPSAACRSCSLSAPLATWRAMLPLMVASAALTRSGDRSLSLTEIPAAAQTWAMPLPIWPRRRCRCC